MGNNCSANRTKSGNTTTVPFYKVRVILMITINRGKLPPDIDYDIIITPSKLADWIKEHSKDISNIRVYYFHTSNAIKGNMLQHNIGFSVRLQFLDAHMDFEVPGSLECSSSQILKLMSPTTRGHPPIAGCPESFNVRLLQVLFW
jgi:hypothetical protein